MCDERKLTCLNSRSQCRTERLVTHRRALLIVSQNNYNRTFVFRSQRFIEDKEVREKSSPTIPSTFTVYIPWSDPISWSNIARIWSRAVILVSCETVRRASAVIWRRMQTKCHRMNQRVVRHVAPYSFQCKEMSTFFHFGAREMTTVLFQKTPSLCFFIGTYGRGRANDRKLDGCILVRLFPKFLSLSKINTSWTIKLSLRSRDRWRQTLSNGTLLVDYLYPRPRYHRM